MSLRSPVPGVRADRAARLAVHETAVLLAEAGHTVVRRDPVIPTEAAVAALVRWFAGAEDDAAHLGVDRAALEPRSRTHAWLGRWVRRLGLVRPGPAERFRARTERFFTDVDVLLTPLVSGPPLSARPWHERGFLANVTANARWAPFASPWNLAGVPAAAVPAGLRPQGWPLAVQLVGPPGAEGRLLWLAAELERRRPWRRHAPVFDPLSSPATAAV